MSNVSVLPNVPSKIARFFGEVSGEHIPELLFQLEVFLKTTTAVINHPAEGERKSALIAERVAILRMLQSARSQASQL